jgi:hypothetical protein
VKGTPNKYQQNRRESSGTTAITMRPLARAVSTAAKYDHAINLAKGHPNPKNCLPHDVIRRAVLASAARLEVSAGEETSGPGFPLSYGPSKGQPRLLAALAEFITRQGGPQEAAARQDGLFITNGVSHGLDLVVQVAYLIPLDRSSGPSTLSGILSTPSCLLQQPSGSFCLGPTLNRNPDSPSLSAALAMSCWWRRPRTFSRVGYSRATICGWRQCRSTDKVLHPLGVLLAAGIQPALHATRSGGGVTGVMRGR